MPMLYRSRAISFLFALFVGLFVALGMPACIRAAQAQDVPAPDPCAGAIPPDAADDVGGIVAAGAKAIGASVSPFAAFIASGAFASGLIIAALLWLQMFWKPFFAPDPATEVSRRRVLVAALGVGQGLGLIGFAPAVPVPGVVLTGAALWFGKALGGFMASTIAVFGNNFYKRSIGAREEKRAITAAMTTGQFKALRAEEGGGEAGFTLPGFIGVIAALLVVGALAYAALAGLVAEVP
jgi:hypothetical protein